MKELNLRFGKTLVAFALILLFLGLSFNIGTPVGINRDDKNYVSVSIDKSVNTDVNVTTTDGQDPLPTNNTVSSNKGNNSTDSNSTSTIGVDENNSQSSEINSNNTDINNQNDNSNISNNNILNNSQEENSREINNNVNNNLDLANLKKEIEKSYGISILYGSDTDGYVVGGYGVVSINDENTIYNALINLRNNLALYPINFFKEMRSGGLPLTIYLIQRYTSANITGITQKTKNGVIISIAVDFPFSDSFHHENYHYMEHYIYLKGGNYSNWNNYNSSGFTYGVYDEKLVYDITFSEDAYFVNSYAQSYEYEDRASTFEYMMASSKISPLNYGNNIWKKATVMSEMIDYYFNTVNSTTVEYWERFLQ